MADADIECLLLISSLPDRVPHPDLGHLDPVLRQKRVGLTQRLPVLLQQTSRSYAGQPARPSAPPAETVDGQRGTDWRRKEGSW